MKLTNQTARSLRASIPAIIVVTGLAMSLLLVTASCKDKPKGQGRRSITAAVSIEPQAYFAGRVGGMAIGVHVMVPPAQSPATYEPTPRQMAELQKADVYFRIGVPFENRFIGKIESIIGADKVVDVRQGIALRSMEEHAHSGDSVVDDHRGDDPHTWLDPTLVKIQARTMAAAFEKIAPQEQEKFERQLKRFEHDLDSVDAVIAELLAPYKGRAIYVYHPSYGYFADRYGLRQVAVETEGKEPSARYLSDLIDRAKADGVTALFVQPQFASGPAHAVADALDAEVIEIDPLAADYLNNLTRMARRISLALEAQGKADQ